MKSENETDVRNRNRLFVTCIAAMVWAVAIKALWSGFTLGHALLLTVWIAAGSQHYSSTFSDFTKRLTAKKLLGLVLLAPGWPFLYLNLVGSEKQ